MCSHIRPSLDATVMNAVTEITEILYRNKGWREISTNVKTYSKHITTAGVTKFSTAKLEITFCNFVLKKCSTGF